MSLHKDPKLKAAVLDLPQKEKDKLLVRLVSKDKMLMKQLHFQLLEDELDLEQRIESLREKLERMFDTTVERYDIQNTPNTHYYRNLNNLMRVASGLVNEHEKVTKDKLSEVEFRIFILNAAFENFPRLFEPSSFTTAFKMQQYVVMRVRATANKYAKLHEDLRFDLRENMGAMLEFADQHRLLG